MPRRSPSLVLVHIVWSTSKRQPVLVPSLDASVLGSILETTRGAGCAMLAGGCAPDHVHVVVRLAASVPLSDLVIRMKGASSFTLNHPPSADRRFVWQDGYWAQSQSPEDLTPIADYVLAQRQRHDDSHAAEAWMSTKHRP